MSTMIPVENFDLIDSDLVGYTEAQYQALNVLIEDIVEDTGIKKNRAIVSLMNIRQLETDPGSLFDWSKIGL